MLSVPHSLSREMEIHLNFMNIPIPARSGSLEKLNYAYSIHLHMYNVYSMQGWRVGISASSTSIFNSRTEEARGCEIGGTPAFIVYRERERGESHFG
jgi:hypothetical protein